MNIVVFGFKSCGKGFIGRALAEISGMQFVDTDDIIEEIYFEKSGKRISYREIAKKQGMPFFRQLEEEAVKRVAGLDEKVIAAGGGTLLSAANVKALRENGKLVLLRVGKQELFKRIMASGVPAFFDSKDPKGSFERLFKQRMKRFEKIADFKVECGERSREAVSKEILRLVAKA